jgi:hypothetical protein
LDAGQTESSVRVERLAIGSTRHALTLSSSKDIPYCAISASTGTTRSQAISREQATGSTIAQIITIIADGASSSIRVIADAELDLQVAISIYLHIPVRALAAVCGIKGRVAIRNDYPEDA